MTTKEALLEVGTAFSITPEFKEKMIPTAIYLFKGNVAAVEWFVEDYGYFIDDENIASVSHRIEIPS